MALVSALVKVLALAALDFKVYGYTFRGHNSFIFIFASLINGGVTCKEKN